LVGLRVELWLAISIARRRRVGLRPTLVIGPANRVQQLQHRLATYPEAGLRHMASYIPSSRDGATPESGRVLVTELLRRYPVDHVLLAANDTDETILRDFVRFGAGRVDCSLALPVAGIASSQTRAHLGDLSLIPIRLRPSWGSAAAKRAFDLIVASVLLLLVSPLLAVAAVAIRVGDEGPAIFRQRRVGLHGKPFTIYKFRSMVVDAEKRQRNYADANVNTGLLFKIDRDPRITPVGAAIRRFSIDELPQLLNVIKGDMSLVGPRPLPVDPDQFDIGAQIRHRALPGITGLWQVNGANALPYADMVDLDLTYITTRTLGGDLQLIARTLPALLIRRSAY
jgi:lipopolysaccharide/colanic/teichoic acid biosynthesis glycosyltransferase